MGLSTPGRGLPRRTIALLAAAGAMTLAATGSYAALDDIQLVTRATGAQGVKSTASRSIR